MADARRMIELGMVPPLAKEVATQIDNGGEAGAVNSVNGQTGTVVLDAEDVGALPDTYTPPAPDWDDVTGKPSTFPATTPVATATALATTRAFSLTGDVTATAVNFNGTAPVALATTIAAGVIVNADISASAAIALTKLADFEGGVNDLIEAASLGKTANTATGSTTINAANHNGQPWQITSAGAATITLDDDLPQGSEVTIYSLGAGVVTIATETNTLNVLGGADPELPGQYSAAFARKTGATAWTLIVGVPGGEGSGIESVVAGTGIAVDTTDPKNPIVSVTSSDAANAVLFADNTATASYTGVTTEQTITEWSVVIPAGTVGPNSEIVIDAFYAHAVGNTNVKTFRAKIGGQNFIAYPSPANAVPVRVRKSVFSNDSVSSQFQFTAAGNDITAVSGTSIQTSSVDFSVDQTVTCTIQLAVDTDTFTGRRLRVEVRDIA